ncbi:MAG: JAB domain-containing protein [Treponema sp.]|nr:JAB domain-containing protein [Treponema sp.]MCL2272757.1 JAB domain-containing protein [Treponema sp.]
MTFEIISSRKFKKEIFFSKPADIFGTVKRYAKSRQEHFLVITLDGSHKIISIHIMSIGLADKTIVHPREVFFYAIKDNATALVFAHNHPSGQLGASKEDEEITGRLVNASILMGFHILDHIIFNRKGYYSMREYGFKFDK